MKKLFSILAFMLPAALTFGQITVTTGIPVPNMVQNTLVGSGVSVTNITYTGNANAIGQFQTGAVPTNLGISEGIILSSGVVNGTPAIGAPANQLASTSNNTPGDPMLTSIAGSTTYDAAILTFDFVPLSDTIRFRYVFGSEEYHNYVNSSFNDVFAFFISGPNPQGGNYNNYNIARLPGTTIPVSINTVNNGYTFNACSSGPCTNCAFFVDNCNGTSIVYNAFTVVLTAWALVVPCQTYHLKIAIADAGDGILDSGVFLEANSFTSPGISTTTSYSIPAIGNFAVEGCNDVILSFCLPQALSNDYNIPIQVAGTATNGVDYTFIPSTLTIPAGSLCIDFVVEAFLDNIAEGIETIELIVQTDLCGSFDTIVVEIYDYFSPVVTAISDTTICLGDTLLLEAHADLGWPPFEYLWDNQTPGGPTHLVIPDQDSIFHVLVTDLCGYADSTQIQVYVATTDVDAGPDQTICSGETAILSASGGTSYTWSNGDQGATIQVSPTETTTYIVTATGVCIPVDSVIVFVTPETEIFLTQPAPVCSGEYIEITASGGELYIWASSPPDGTLNSQNTNAVIHVKPNVTTIYSVTGSIYGCTGSAHITAEIYPSPSASFIIEPPVVSSFNPIVNFLDNSSGLPISWYWDFGDQNYSVIQHPTHTYSDSGGVFPVTLIITNVHGCIDSITQNVIVRPDHVLYVPNAFTPGSDGINDEIFVLSTGVSEQDFEWIILNRWGKIVFYSNDLNRGWDGRDRGVLAPQGVYTYKLTFRDKANLLHQRYGIITLIR